jgi:hypothetical protein
MVWYRKIGTLWQNVVTHTSYANNNQDENEIAITITTNERGPTNQASTIKLLLNQHCLQPLPFTIFVKYRTVVFINQQVVFSK